jgi:hypothetical protein
MDEFKHLHFIGQWPHLKSQTINECLRFLETNLGVKAS